MVLRTPQIERIYILGRLQDCGLLKADSAWSSLKLGLGGFWDLGYGQLYDHLGMLSRLRIHSNGATVLTHDIVADR